MPAPEAVVDEPLRLLFIGRLDSHKRLDWLFDSLVKLTTLAVGGRRGWSEASSVEKLARRLFPTGSPVRFLGRLSEQAKMEQVSIAESLCCLRIAVIEAFGTVQLEAMAGRIPLAFDQPRSGMGWVGRLSGCRGLSPRGFV